MADFAATLGLLRKAEGLGLSKILEVIKKAYLSRPAPVQGFPEFLRALRYADDKRLSMLRDELLEQYIDDNPVPDKPEETRTDRVKTEIANHLASEKEAGRPRPARVDLEAHIRKTEGVSDRQLQADLVEAYNGAVAVGLVAPRA